MSQSDDNTKEVGAVRAVEAKVAAFFAQYPKRTWHKGQIVIHAKEEPDGVYFIESGALRQYAISNNGDEVVINIFRNPAYIPMPWAIGRQKNVYFFDAIEDAVLRCAPREAVVAFVEQNPDVLMGLLKRLYSGLDGFMMRMVYLMKSTARERLVYELLILSKRAKPGSKQTEVVLPVKSYQLSSYCGLTPETVSRELKQLKNQQLVTLQGGNIIVKSIAALEAELGQYA